jgi:hypothetical protein
MPRKLSNRSMVATLLGLLIAVPAAVLTLAAPASAANGPCCQVAINNMPGQFQAGGDPKSFTMHVVNRTNSSIRYINATFTFRANGLSSNEIHLQRQRVAGGPRSIGTRNRNGQVTANDQIDLLALPPGAGINIQYTLSFTQKAPGAGLSLSVEVQQRRGDSGPANAGPYQSRIVAFGAPKTSAPTKAAAPSPSPTISDTPASTDATDDGVPTDQSTLLGGDSGSDSGGGSLMWIAYTLGALLLLGGIGVIGTMLYRRGPRAVETEWNEHGQPGYQETAYQEPYQEPPHQGGGYAPTQVADYGAATQVAGYGPAQGGHYGAPTQAMPAQSAPTRVTPATRGVPGRHAAPTQRPAADDPYAQDPYSQEPYADGSQTWFDPDAGR